MLRLYGFIDSGNSNKIRLVLKVLHRPFEDVLLEREDPLIYSLNPLGKVPVLVLPDGKKVVESIAILYYLGCNTPLWPTELDQQTQVLQWLSFEQAEIQQSIGRLRYRLKFAREPVKNEPCYTRQAHDALTILNNHLAEGAEGEGRFVVRDHFSIADIALYAYISLAPEANLTLDAYPSVQKWLKVMAHKMANGYSTKHGSPYDRGSADSYYNRERQPHYGGVNDCCPRITFLTVKEIEGYNAGYDDHELFGVKKTYD